MCRFLAAGKHVVATSVVSLVYPPSAPSGWVRQLEAACREGNTACFTSGIDPGFANDLLPLVVSGFSERIDTIRIVENLDYSTYMQPEVLFDTMGFGQPPESTPLLLLPGALTFVWGGVLHMIAAGLGEELDDHRLGQGAAHVADPSATRGSSQATTRSVTSETTMKMVAMTRTPICTTG